MHLEPPLDKQNIARAGVWMVFVYPAVKGWPGSESRMPLRRTKPIKRAGSTLKSGKR
jgi:hypothetical protein